MSAEDNSQFSNVRVRFCPSPTGTPHVGMVRTCLFNWAYARHTGGTFVFRIEDTDAARDSEESFNQIIDSLKWLGLDWDEGIGIGGPNGPYRQSERMDIYKEVAAKLLEAGYAYESFSTPEEIEQRHKEAGRDPKLGYDGYDRNLTDEEKQKFLDEGRQPVLRMRMPDEDITFTDLVRGDITFKAGVVPDYVIVRANGDPLYTLTNPVDDAMMDINTVLRGEDILSSTPRQIVMHKALVELGIGKQVPQFGHLPYVMGEGNKKLSKRDPESNLLLHKENGMIPEGLLNYLALLGWSISPDNDIFSKEEMIAAFDVRDVNPNPARFDQKKCNAINAEHIRMLGEQDFMERVVPYLFASGFVSADTYEQLSETEANVLKQACPLIQTRIQVLGESAGMLGFFFTANENLQFDEKSVAKLRDDALHVLQVSREVITNMETFDTTALHDELSKVLVEGEGIKPRFAFTPLRVAVTGRQVSPPLFESMEILGKDDCLVRIDSLISILESK